MVATAFQIFVLGVLASRLIDDFGLTRFELGLVGTVNTAVGALSAPLTGRITDRIGPRSSTMIAQLWCAVGFAIMASAHTSWQLMASAVVLGVPQGWGNPATNALIVERVPAGRRGTTTGIKQSGVQLGVFLAGITLPTLSDAIGWRGAMWFYAAVFAVLAALPLALSKTPTAQSLQKSDPAEVDSAMSATAVRSMRLLAFYALLMGISGGGISRFLALFAEEAAGMSNTTAGLVIAVSGIVGMAARVYAGRIAEHRVAPLRLLALLAGVGAVVCVLLMMTLNVGAWMLWPIAFLAAVGLAAWNAVAMLAIIVGVPAHHAGRASGIVMFGFLAGLAIGPPLAGLAIDAADSYQPVWITALALTVASAVLAEWTHRRPA